MNCREAHQKLADLSADTLSSTEANELKQHLDKCPPCLEEWHLLHVTIHSLSTVTQPLLHQTQSQQIWHHCLSHIEEKTERERLLKKSNEYSLSAKTPWFRAPWLGWATLATSFAVLGAVWFSSTPKDAVSPNPTNIVASLPNNSNAQTEWASFQVPPAAASPYINHHTLMAFDPFSDRVGTTLVADTIAESSATRSTPEAIR